MSNDSMVPRINWPLATLISFNTQPIPHPSLGIVQGGKLITLPWAARDNNVALTQERTLFRRTPLKADIQHKPSTPFGWGLAAHHCWAHKSFDPDLTFPKSLTYGLVSLSPSEMIYSILGN